MPPGKASGPQHVNACLMAQVNWRRTAHLSTYAISYLCSIDLAASCSVSSKVSMHFRASSIYALIRQRTRCPCSRGVLRAA